MEFLRTNDGFTHIDRTTDKTERFKHTQRSSNEESFRTEKDRQDGTTRVGKANRKSSKGIPAVDSSCYRKV